VYIALATIVLVCALTWVSVSTFIVYQFFVKMTQHVISDVVLVSNSGTILFENSPIPTTSVKTIIVEFNDESENDSDELSWTIEPMGHVSVLLRIAWKVDETRAIRWAFIVR